jgi:hypothetical protein
VGRVDGLHFRLTTRNPLIRNFVDSILKGQIVESPGGSRLLGTFRMEEFAAIFMPVWLVLAMLIAITASVSALIAPERWSPAGRSLATRQERRFVAQLDEIFGVRPIGT